MKRGKKESSASSDILVYQLGQMANLLSLLAEETEKAAVKTEKATTWIVYLTWVIAILTGILVLTIFFEFPKIVLKTNQNSAIHTQTTKNDNKAPSIQELPERHQNIPNVSPESANKINNSDKITIEKDISKNDNKNME